MTNELITIFDRFTPLTKDKDLFYLEMPLDTSGLWLEDRIANRTSVGYQEYTAFYRGKDKALAAKNIAILSKAVDNLDCRLDGKLFAVKRLWDGWDYVGKDDEGYFVFSTAYRLYVA